MAPRIITSEPRPSIRHPKWHYCYFNAKTNSGRQCVAVIPNSLVGVVRRGYAFDDETDLHWNDDLQASVLTVDFDTPPEGDPAQPPDKDTGWADPDTAASLGVADPTVLRQFAAERGLIPEPPKLDASLEELLEQACMAYNYACRRIGVVEKPRAMEAQKLVTTCLIPWLKDRGVTLTQDEERAMTF